MLRNRLTENLKTAQKAKDACAVSTLRLILAALKDRDIAARGKGNADGINEDEILSMLQTMVKQRRDSIELYRRGGREDLAERDEREIAIIEGFLPEQLSDAEIQSSVDAAIAETGADGLKDMGKVMAHLRGNFGGQMDFARASGIVKAQLGHQ
jgi:uncharacterized protein YqeY